MYFEHQLNNN